MASHYYQMRWYTNFKICKYIYFLRSYENREVLANLKTDLDKNLLLPTSEEIYPLTKYFGTFYMLVQFPFTSSETELYHYQYKLNVRVTSRVVKRLKKLENFRKITKLSAHIVQCPMSLAEIKIWQCTIKLNKFSN